MRARFDPTSTGAKSATLTVTSNAADVTVTLAGTGTQTEMSRIADRVAFGPQDIDEASTGCADLDGRPTPAPSPSTLTAITLTGSGQASLNA